MVIPTTSPRSIEGYHVDERLVFGGTRPAYRMALLGLAIQRLPSRKEALILPVVTLLLPHKRIPLWR